jgi:arginine utilization protein RocB
VVAVVSWLQGFPSGFKMKNARKKRIKKLTLDLVRVQSDTGSRLEIDVENFLHAWLGELAYFKSHPDYFGLYPLTQDPMKRSAVWGLVKGQGDQTVILLHHHDVVDAFDYGSLAKQAYDPPVLQGRLLEMALSEEVRQDLESGQWLFGRGTGDMKGGAAIQLVLLEEYAARPDFKGNILLLSVPDEESLSEGMRGSLQLLVDLKARFKLNYRMLINSEPHGREQDKNGVFYVGSAGKILPVVYARGKKTHIGHIYQGFNPVLLLSEIVLQTELNTDFADRVRGEVAPPPSWIYLRDRKEVYDASVPPSAGGYLSLIHLKSTPVELIQQLKTSCETAFGRVIEKIQLSHAAYSRKKNEQASAPSWSVKVRTFAELYQQALADSGGTFQAAYDTFLASIVSDIEQQRLNMPEATFQIIEMTLGHVRDLSPMVVIALCPPYYPPIHNDDFNGLPASVQGLTEHLIRFAAERWQEVYRITNYMMGITDMSYAALQNRENIVPYIGPNMPLWRKTYSIPFAEMQSLSIPVINIGPWGKDHHKFTERVYEPDLYERTPALLECAVDYILERDS